MGKHNCGGRKTGTNNITMLGESPCDHCLRGLEYCKNNSLACGDYVHYVKHGKVLKRDRNPTSLRYLEISTSDSQKSRTKEESQSQVAVQKARIKDYLRKNKEILKEIIAKKTGILSFFKKETEKKACQ